MPSSFLFLLGPTDSAGHTLLMQMEEAQDQVGPIVPTLLKTLLVFPMLIFLAKTSNMVQGWKSMNHPLKEGMGMAKVVATGKSRELGPLTQTPTG